MLSLFVGESEVGGGVGERMVGGYAFRLSWRG